MKGFPIACFLFFICCGYISAQGVSFLKGDWEDVVEQATLTNKGIFIDFYTTWCGPCRKMDKTTFQDQQVAAVYNDQFVNYKVDAEKGEGILLANSFGVKAYPTFLYLDAKGVLLFTTRGFKKPDVLIKLAELVASLKTDQKLGNLMQETVNLSKKELQYLLEHGKEFYSNNKPFYLTKYYGLLNEEEKKDRELQRIYLSQYKLIKDHSIKDQIIANYTLPSAFEKTDEDDLRLHYNMNEILNDETIASRKSDAYPLFKRVLDRKVQFLLKTNRIKAQDTTMMYMENDLLFYGYNDQMDLYEEIAIPFMEQYFLPKLASRKNIAITRNQTDQVLFLSICDHLSKYYGADKVKNNRIIGWLDQIIKATGLIEAYKVKAKIYKNTGDELRKNKTIYEALSKPINPKQRDDLNKLLDS